MLAPPERSVDSGHCMRDFSFSRASPTSSLMSECMSLRMMSRSASLSKSNTLMLIDPQGVRGKSSRLRRSKRSPPTFS